MNALTVPVPHLLSKEMVCVSALAWMAKSTDVRKAVRIVMAIFLAEQESKGGWR